MSLQTPEFKYLTEERLQEWKAPAAGSKLADRLCWSVVRGSLPFPKCKMALDSVAFSEGNGKDEVGSVFADVIAHMGQDLTLPGEYRVRLTKMLTLPGEYRVRLTKMVEERDRDKGSILKDDMDSTAASKRRKL